MDANTYNLLFLAVLTFFIGLATASGIKDKQRNRELLIAFFKITTVDPSLQNANQKLVHEGLRLLAVEVSQLQEAQIQTSGAIDGNSHYANSLLLNKAQAAFDLAISIAKYNKFLYKSVGEYVKK